MLPDTHKEWEKEWKKLYERLLGGGDINTIGSVKGRANNLIKDFIRTTLKEREISLRKEWAEKVREMYQDEHPTEDGVPVETYGYEAEFNNALKQVLALIEPDSTTAHEPPHH